MTYEFGLMAKPLHQQMGVSEKSVAHIQKAIDGIIGLKLTGLMTDSEHGKILRRAVKKLDAIYIKEQEAGL